jgi:hypothetical protein
MCAVLLITQVGFAYSKGSMHGWVPRCRGLIDVDRQCGFRRDCYIPRRKCHLLDISFRRFLKSFTSVNAALFAEREALVRTVRQGRLHWLLA